MTFDALTLRRKPVATPVTSRPAPAATTTAREVFGADGSSQSVFDLQRLAGNQAVAQRLAGTKTSPKADASGKESDKELSARFADEPSLQALLGGGPPLTAGASGPAVARVQRALVDLMLLPVGGATGVLDAPTQAALKAFQKAEGLPESGIVDKTTARHLDAAFDSRKPYVDQAKHIPAAPGTHPLTPADRAAAVAAMVAAPVPGASVSFKDDLGPPKGRYGPRIKAALATIIVQFHKELFEDKKSLRADPGKNFYAWSTLEAPALAAQKVVDAVYASHYGGPGAKHPLTHAGLNLIDQWEDEIAIDATMSATARKDKAADKVRYLIDSNCDTINAEHSAIPSRAPEKAILDPIVAEFVNTPAKVQALLDLDIGWEGAQLMGKVYMQRYKSTDPDANTAKEKNRVHMWELFHTYIHEYIHTLAHRDFIKFADSFAAAGDDTRYNTLMEGFCDFFTLNVLATVNPSTVQAAVEGPYANGKPPPVLTPSVYPSHRMAEQVVGVVGVRNAQRAYFDGQTALIGKP